MTTIKVCILSNVDRRPAVSYCAGITESSKICDIYCPHSYADQLHGHVIITKAAIKHNSRVAVTITDKSKIFQTSAFNVDPAILQSFLHAPIITIQDALATPIENRDRYVSLRGTVSEVSEIKHGVGWCRREILIAQGEHTITIKLWGALSSTDITKGQKWLFENVAIKFYDPGQGYSLKVSAANTAMTHVEQILDDLDYTKVVTIHGLVHKGEIVEVITDEGSEHAINSAHWPEYITPEDLPMQMVLEVRGGAVVGCQVHTS